MDWLTTDNVAKALAILAAVQALAATIVKITPTPKDDAILDKVISVFRFVGSIFTVPPKQ